MLRSVLGADARTFEAPRSSFRYARSAPARLLPTLPPPPWSLPLSGGLPHCSRPHLAAGGACPCHPRPVRIPTRITPNAPRPRLRSISSVLGASRAALPAPPAPLQHLPFVPIGNPSRRASETDRREATRRSVAAASATKTAVHPCVHPAHSRPEGPARERIGHRNRWRGESHSGCFTAAFEYANQAERFWSSSLCCPAVRSRFASRLIALGGAIIRIERGRGLTARASCQMQLASHELAMRS